jgi:hypothetical protein
LDRASRDALLFAGRRLGADGVVLLFATRDDDGVTDLRGLRVVGLSGLSQSAAAALLAEQAADLTPDLRDRVIEEAKGNPLALIELAAVVRSGDSTVAPPILGTGLSTTARRVLDSFGSQVDRLPAATRLALLVTAAEDTGQLGVILSAIQRIGLQLNDFGPAERARLVGVVGNEVTFRHPLIRSAVYGRASAACTRRAAAAFRRSVCARRTRHPAVRRHQR